MLYDPSLPVLVINLKESKSAYHEIFMYSCSFILFKIAKIGILPRCLSACKLLKKCDVYTDTMELYSVIKEVIVSLAKMDK